MRDRHPLSRHRVAVGAAFFVQGFTFVALTAKLPALQDSLDLSPSAFSVLMLALVLMAGVGSLVGEWVAGRSGSAASLRLGFAITACMLPALAWSSGVALLALAMAGYGLGLGLVDAGSNMQAVSLEHRYGRPILPTFHAAWTCGGIVGTLGALATHTWSFTAAALVLALAPVIMVGLPYLRHDESPEGPVAAATPKAAADAVVIPWRRILTLGLALVLFYMVDTAVTTWAPTYLHRTFHAHDALVAVATLPYLVGSLISRGAGDHLTARYGAPALVRVAGIVGALGLAGAVFAGHPALALGGLAVAGVSLAVVAPLAYSTSAQLSRRAHAGRGARDEREAQAATDAVIARFNQFNYVGGLLGAVLTGALGDASLRYGFAVPMVLVLALLPLSRAFTTRAA